MSSGGQSNNLLRQSRAPGRPQARCFSQINEPHAHRTEWRLFGCAKTIVNLSQGSRCVFALNLRRGTDQALTSRERQAFRFRDLDRFPTAGADFVAADRLDRGAELLQMGRVLGHRRQEQLILEV